MSSDLDADVLKDFTKESLDLVTQLNEIVENLEDLDEDDDYPVELLEGFSQKIDRIMGAAATLGMLAPDHPGLKKVTKIAELCKGLGYAAAQDKNPQAIPIFAAFWADTLEVMESLIENIDNEFESLKIATEFAGVLQRRLEWLSGKLKPAQAYGTGGAAASDQARQVDVNELISDLTK